MSKQVAIHFTGGKESTYLTIRLLETYDKVHLLTFKHWFIRGVDRVGLNIKKLQDIFGEDRIESKVFDVEEMTKGIFEKDRYKDFKKYKTWSSNQFCGACRLSMFVYTVDYCMEKGITVLRDGSNKSGFDLCQQPWAFEILKEFFGKYGIDYQWELFDTARCDFELFKYGIELEKPVLFYRSQAGCQGGGIFHNLYLRMYFLPLYGSDKHKEYGQKWLKERISFCEEILDEINVHSRVLAGNNAEQNI